MELVVLCGLCAAGPPYYPGQTMYTPSPSIIVPTPQQPPPAKREKKTVSVIIAYIEYLYSSM